VKFINHLNLKKKSRGKNKSVAVMATNHLKAEMQANPERSLYQIQVRKRTRLLSRYKNSPRYLEPKVQYHVHKNCLESP
jgi:hypothetical protein